MNELLIFAKYPEPGRVKTRLARIVGPEQAAFLYQEMVETVVGKTGEGESRRVLCFDPPEREADVRRWFPGLEMRPQSDGDLGQRMLHALQGSLISGSQRAVLVGTDCVALDRALVHEAFQRLERSDLVLGPAHDGGYYLIGMNQAHSVLFTGIPWSTDQVLAATLAKAEAGRLQVELLKILSDMDSSGDCLARSQ